MKKTKNPTSFFVSLHSAINAFLAFIALTSNTFNIIQLYPLLISVFAKDSHSASEDDSTADLCSHFSPIFHDLRETEEKFISCFHNTIGLPPSKRFLLSHK